ncbi:short-chain dehydrogenase [Candidatus Marinamargulisbacteria bacterium SCGC AG-410-N11]|nr:short-chain dehydrogenase [Candidatus Marinamargulisbacteria bacterium SCGC AG-410-N11]
MIIKNIAVFGSSGAIGYEFLNKFIQDKNVENLFSFSRKPINTIKSNILHHYSVDITSEESIKKACSKIPNDITLDLVIVATGFLHNDTIKPEKSISRLNQEAITYNLQINTVGPLLIAKYIMPKLTPKNRALFVALSARVGSISDNKLGGWISYRTSKAALNMGLKTIAIEQKLRQPKHIVLGLHPGSVDSNLSKPFQKNSKYTFFEAGKSVMYLLKVINQSREEDSGKLFDWSGKEITY